MYRTTRRRIALCGHRPWALGEPVIRLGGEMLQGIVEGMITKVECDFGDEQSVSVNYDRVWDNIRHWNGRYPGQDRGCREAEETGI